MTRCISEPAAPQELDLSPAGRAGAALREGRAGPGQLLSVIGRRAGGRATPTVGRWKRPRRTGIDERRRTALHQKRLAFMPATATLKRYGARHQTYNRTAWYFVSGPRRGVSDNGHVRHTVGNFGDDLPAIHLTGAKKPVFLTNRLASTSKGNKTC